MPNTYNYIDTSGNMQQFQADTPEAALAGAPNIDPKSGVQIVTAPTQPAQSPIVTTGPQWTNYNNATNSLNNFVNTADPYMALFQQQRDANKLAAENAIASATAEKERAAIKTEEERNAVMAGLATAAEKTGLAPNSAYQLQVIQGAQNSFNTRFELLDRQEKLAIAKAKAAQAVGDTAVLKEQLDYAVKLRKEKADALAEAQKLEWEKYKFEHMTPYQKALLALQRERLSKTGVDSDKLLSTSKLNYIKKNNPLLDLGLNDTEEDLNNAMKAADKLVQALNAAYNNPEFVVDGYYTYDFINQLNKALPQGISKVGVLRSIKDRLAIGNLKKAKKYGITPEEYELIIKED